VIIGLLRYWKAQMTATFMEPPVIINTSKGELKNIWTRVYPVLGRTFSGFATIAANYAISLVSDTKPAVS
jgi:hypothetical protein